jgi:hypothetical protein
MGKQVGTMSYVVLIKLEAYRGIRHSDLNSVSRSQPM